MLYVIEHGNKGEEKESEGRQMKKKGVRAGGER
jgi:hypothetical protein